MRRDRSTSRAPLGFLPAPVRGAIAFLLLSLNTIICFTALFPLALLKLAIPTSSVRRRIDPLLHRIVEGWIAGNGLWIALVGSVSWEIEGVEQLRIDGWYLVEANHLSWADVFVLQKVLNGRIPLVKFPLKRRLIWVPLAGLAWWALDFPFMSRHSEEFLREHPELRGQDLAAIRKACEKFRLVPTSVGSFLEGTRLTRDKHAAQQSEYRHLLRPKAGAVALALNAMGDQFESLLDVTIHYPTGAPTFFGLLSGKMERVIVLVNERPIPPDLIGGDYAGDAEYRSRAQQWVNELWREKDRRLDELHRQRS